MLRVLARYVLLKPSELPVVLWAFLYYFSLLASYFVLRPLRDELGIVNGASNMQWLFTGTFISMLLIVPVFGKITSRYRMGSVLKASYLFFISSVALFYLCYKMEWYMWVMPLVFFIWLSVFNLFAISLFWSVMVDIFSAGQSKRLFGIISAGGSLGALMGPVITALVSSSSDIENLFLIAIVLLLVTLLALHKILRLQGNRKKAGGLSEGVFGNAPLNKKGIFEGIRLVWNSPHLRGLALFMLLYTSVSTFLYFEQAHIVEQALTKSADRLGYFSRVDLITNLLAITGQFFLTNRILGKFGLALALGGIPLLIGVGFVALSQHTVLIIIALLLIFHRAGNFMVMRPGREVLYTICNREEKYRAKNFLDTAIYRGGDALSGWAFAGLVSLGLGLSPIAIIAVPLVALWSYVGFQLGKKVDRSPKKMIRTLKMNK
ncbi:NTP/NDP exchange transporter [Spongiimicrobium sp. 2-473A-2-J]|uniref:NTP/NDP exchange transporter n=1 Tax=Eudoraea algarum TaxID=3417568 RepID=UPI003D368F14